MALPSAVPHLLASDGPAMLSACESSLTELLPVTLLTHSTAFQSRNTVSILKQNH